MLGIFTNNILTRAFWGDEAWTALISALPIPDLLRTTAADFHPPLYYSLIHFWIQFFGNSEVGIRTASLIFWLLSGMAVFLFARSLRFSSRLRLLAVGLVLFNPFIFQYAFEARNYTLFVFLSLASMWQFYEILKKPNKKVFYLLTTILGLYTHYYMFFVVAAQYLFVLLFRRDLFKKFLFLGLGLFLLYLPWLPFFFSQAKNVAGSYWIGAISWQTIAGAALILVTGEQRTIFTYLLPLFFVAYLAMAAAKSKKLSIAENRLFLFWILVPFLLPMVISWVRPIFFYRYFVFLAAPVMLWPLFLGRSWALPLVLLAIYLYSDGVLFVTSTSQHFKPILAQIHREAKRSDTIYTVLPSFAEVVYYNNYDGRPLPVVVLPVGLTQASGKALLDTYVRKHYLALENPLAQGRYWFLEPGPKYLLVNK